MTLGALAFAMVSVPYATGDPGTTDLQISETSSPASVLVHKPPYPKLTWTLVVKNNGPLADTNVQVSDPMPTGNGYVSAATTSGNCTGGPTLTCDLGTMQPGDLVTVTLVTEPTITGNQVNTATVAGDVAEMTPADNSASATVFVYGIIGVPSCVAVVVRPQQLHAGRLTTLHLKLTLGRTHNRMRGVRVRISGPGIKVTTKPSNRRGTIVTSIKPSHRGFVVFKPLARPPYGECGAKVGVIGVVTPPVTG